MSAVKKTHREVLRNLSSEDRKMLMVRSDWAGLAQLVGHLGLIAVMIWLNVILSGAWQILAMTGQGIAMVFLFTAMHECSHATAFRSRWMNQAVGLFAGAVLVIGPRWFFYFHQDHHKFTQDPVRDPELAAPKPASAAAYLWYLTGLPFWVSNLRVLVGNALGRRDDAYVPSIVRQAVFAEARWMLVVYAVVIPAFVHQGWFVTYILVPLLLGQPFLRAYLLAEHAGCEQGSGNMLTNTRTLLTAAPVRFLAWNMPYHTEHHSFPAVPFHRLPHLHRLMRNDVANLDPGYLSFHRRFAAGLPVQQENLAEDG